MSEPERSAPLDDRAASLTLPAPVRTGEADSFPHLPGAVGSRRNHYLPTLDAWRAAAAFLMVACHAAGELPQWRIPGMAISLASPRWQARLMGVFNGSLGVDLFFALSGFLITYLAAQEAARPGGFRLGAFWVRRAFRIVPLAWTYAALYLVAAVAGWHAAPLPPAGIIAASFLFSMNYLLAQGHVPALLGHLWTLGIEMQFYFLWAVILKLVRPRLLPVAALGGILLVILCRSTAGASGFGADALRLECRGDSLFWGALFGAVLAGGAGRARLVAWLRPWCFAPLFLALAFVADRHPPAYATLQPLLCALVISATVINASAPAFRWMEAGWLRFLGRTSFSIYIWQQVLTGWAVPGSSPAWAALLAPPVSLLWLVPVAWLSYRWIELPGMRLGASLARRNRTLDRN